MKGIPIKFRGKDIKTDKYVYGDLIQSTYKGTIVYEIREHDISKSNYPRYTTVENSIAQFVGYDVNGDEVYEGDRIKDLATGDVTRAKICACDTYESAITTAYFEKV